MSDDKKKEADDFMDAARAVWADKQFGQYMEVSECVERDDALYDHAIKVMADDLYKGAVRAGQSYVRGSGKVFIKKSNAFDPYGSRETIGAKIRTVMSATPEQFLAFAAFRMEEYRNDAKSAKEHEKWANDRFRKLYDAVIKHGNDDLKREAGAIDDDGDYYFDADDE